MDAAESNSLPFRTAAAAGVGELSEERDGSKDTDEDERTCLQGQHGDSSPLPQLPPISTVRFAHLPTYVRVAEHDIRTAFDLFSTHSPTSRDVFKHAATLREPALKTIRFSIYRTSVTPLCYGMLTFAPTLISLQS
jgi:hypothetical protein